MGVAFTNASSTLISNTTALASSTGLLVTLACWFFPFTTGANRNMMGYSNPASTSGTYVAIGVTSTATLLSAITISGGTAARADSALTLTTGVWHFAIARLITATNRRISHLDGTGATSHVQNTTSQTTSALSVMNIGGNTGTVQERFFDGVIGEAWYCDDDIGTRLGVGAGALDDTIFRKLAYEGPFSFPQLAATVVEYRSLFSVDSAHEGVYDNYSRIGRQTWLSSATPPIVGPHPPLPPGYVRKSDLKTNLVI